MMTDKQKTAVYIILLFFIGGGLFTYRLGAGGLIEPDEGRYAEIAREMVESGDWLVPRFDYITHFHKPPMAYWLIASSFSVFGVNEFAARFPSALAALGAVIAAFYIAKKLAGSEAGFLSGIILITMPQFLGSARLAFPDMFLTFFATAALAFFIKGYYAEKKIVPFLFYWIFAALGMMTKGPVVLVIVLIPVVIYAISFREFGLLRRMRPIEGAALFLIISLPWFIFVVMKFPGLWKYFLNEQTVERLTSDFRPTPRYLLSGAFVIMSLPWFIFFPAGAGMIFRDPSKTGLGKNLRYLILLWIFVVLIFFSALRSSLVSYILPAYPPLAIIAGIFFAGQFKNAKLSTALKLSSAFAVLFMAAGAVSCFYFFSILEEGAKYSEFRNAALFAGLALSALTILLVLFLIKNMSRGIFAVLAFIAPFLLVVFLNEAPLLEKNYHVRVKGKYFAEKILELEKPGDHVVMIGKEYPDLPFYLARPVLHLHIAREKRFEDPAVYEKLVLFGKSEEELVKSETRTFFVSKESEFERIRSKYPDNIYPVSRAQEHVLFCNQSM